MVKEDGTGLEVNPIEWALEHATPEIADAIEKAAKERRQRFDAWIREKDIHRVIE